MAKFRGSNLDLKTNQKVNFDTENKIDLWYDGVDLTVNSPIKGEPATKAEHLSRYDQLTEVSGELSSEIDSDISTHAASADHDGRYYTETELDAGQLDSRYYAESEVDTISGVLQTNIDNKPDTLIELTDTPAVYSDGEYLRSTVSGTEWAAVNGLSDLVDDTSPQLGGDLEYNEKNQIFNIALTSDNTAAGDIITVTYGESVVFGDLVYADSIADKFLKGLATNAAVKHPAMGVALESKANGESGKMLLRGTIRDATHFSAFSLGDILFLSDGTAGAWLNAAPGDSGDIVQIVGWVLAANYAYFNPDYTYVEVA